MDEWANSLKELEMLLPPTSGGSVTGVCFITKNVQIVCGENTAEYTRYIFTIYTASLVLQTKAIQRFVITEKAPTIRRTMLTSPYDLRRHPNFMSTNHGLTPV